MNNIINLHNKTIVITGAASGIGRETARIVSEQGAKVVMIDISEDQVQETISLLSGDGHSIKLLDLSLIDTIKPVVEDIVAEYGAIDGLVHCAGISSRKPLNSLKRDGFNNLMNVNFYSFVELVKLFSKRTNMNDGSSIVAMSSISSIKGYKAKTEYCVSKASLDAFIRCMALELAPRQIRVNSIMAAEVLTPLALKAKELNQSLGVSEFNAPLEPSQPYEIANTIAFLLSDATKTITGTSILIDGGATI